MAKWHAQPEYVELFTDRPAELAGFCVVDEDGRYYSPEGGRWTSLDRSAAEQMARELNEGEEGG